MTGSIETIIGQAAVGVVAAILQLLIGLGLAMSSVYLGLRMFDRMTEGINEMDEIKKGNVAVGILMAAVVFSIANVVQRGVANLTSSVPLDMGVGPMIVGLVVGVLQLLVALAAAAFSISLAVKVLDKITTDIDEMKELKRGNVAVAILMAGVLLAVSFVISSGIEGLSRAVDPVALAAALGL
ncbi:Uncharacterised protein [uncultured archaeon]|nr:Uncharacterised protein [uncultured archaeon]